MCRQLPGKAPVYRHSASTSCLLWRVVAGHRALKPWQQQKACFAQAMAREGSQAAGERDEWAAEARAARRAAATAEQLARSHAAELADARKAYQVSSQVCRAADRSSDC